MNILGLGTIIVSLLLHGIVIWLYVPLNWFTTWYETPVRGCNIKIGPVNIPEKVSMEQELDVLVTVQNISNEISCDITGALDAPNFTIKPPKILRKTLDPAEKTTLIWRLFPNKSGKSPLWFNINNMESTYYIAAKAEGFWMPNIGIFMSIFGYFLGGWFSLSWWIDLFRKIKRRSRNSIQEMQ